MQAPPIVHASMRPILSRPSVRPVLGLALVVLAATLWATVGVAVGVMRLSSSLDPGFVGFLRTLIGATALLVFAFATGRKGLGGPFPIATLLIFGAAVSVFQICLFEAFARVGVTITVAVTVCLPPLFVAAFDALRSRRLPGVAVQIAFAVAAAGVLTIVLPNGDQNAHNTANPAECGLLLLASVAFSVLAIAARSLCRSIDPILGTGLGLAVAAVLLGLVCAISGSFQPATLGALAARDIATLLYLGLASTGGAYLAFNLGLRLCPSSTSGLVASMIEPAIAAILAALLLGEVLRETELVGCSAIVVAMLLVSAAELRRSNQAGNRVQGQKNPAHV